MLITTKTYINSSQVKSVSTEEFAGKRFIAAALLAVSFGVLSLQAGFVLNANAEGNPITAPISYSSTPTPSSSSAPITAPEVTPSPSPSASAPVSYPEVIPSPSASVTPSATPSASPEVTPSPSAEPSVEPSSSPSASPSAEPSMTPAPTSTPSSNGNSSSDNSGSSSNSGSNSASGCTNEAPKATKIISALTTGKNEITLNWEKSQSPVTHYAIVYGLQKGKPLYGNTNTGNVTSSAVKGLSAGATYYFKVKGVNDCTPGAYSNEVAVKVGGKFIAPKNTKPFVAGKTTTQNTKTVEQPNLMPKVFENDVKPVNAGLAGKVFDFFKGLFN